MPLRVSCSESLDRSLPLLDRPVTKLVSAALSGIAFPDCQLVYALGRCTSRDVLSVQAQINEMYSSIRDQLVEHRTSDFVTGWTFAKSETLLYYSSDDSPPLRFSSRVPGRRSDQLMTTQR